MFTSSLVRIVDLSRKFAAALAVFGFLATAGLGIYAAKNLSISTDINQLLSSDLDWRKREKEIEEAFPHKVDTLVAVIDGQDSAKADAAAEALAKALAKDKENFAFVARPDSLPFFRESGLLLLSLDLIR